MQQEMLDMANPKTAKKHALQRLKSRQGIKDHNVVDALVEEVLTCVTRIKDMQDGELKELLFKKFNSNSQRKRTYYYKENIYIFSKENVLITTYPLQIRRNNYDK